MDLMKLFSFLGGKNQKIEKLLENGIQAEKQNNLEAAYESYKKAAALGSGKAMAAIGMLYAFKEFRPVKQNNLLELAMQGVPVMPWNFVEKNVPDMKTGFEWFSKAAELSDPKGCFIAGSMLCEGLGCQADTAKGLVYLKKALALGVEDALSAISVYDTGKNISVSDERYEEILRKFVSSVESGNIDRFELYSSLKGGTERQLTMLGKTLVTRQNLNDEKYMEFKYLFSSEGIPLIPCCAKRGNWTSFVRVDLNAFASDDTLITFTSDISNNFVNSSRLVSAGTAVYRSPAFGWLKEEKEAMVFKIDRQHLPSPEALKGFIEEYCLVPKEYDTDNSAFIVENGEKEYSVEIAAITDGKVEVLYRYTIGGSEVLESLFEPQLLELNLNEKA